MRDNSGTKVPFHGWNIVWTVSIAQGLGPGLMAPLGVFMTDLQTTFDADRATISLGGPIFGVVMAVIGIFLGPRLDRGPIRRIMLWGVVIMLVSILGLSRGHELWHLGALLGCAALGISMYGVLPAQVLLVNWFNRRRGQALALATLGMSGAGLGIPPLCAWMIERVGWRDSIALLGVSAALVTFPLIHRYVIKRPADVGQVPDGDEAQPVDVSVGLRIPVERFLRDPSFWYVGLGFGMCLAGLSAGLHLVPFGEDMGLSRQRAAWAPTALSAGSLVGKLVGGWMIDYVGKRPIVALLVGVQMTGWAVLANDPGFPGLLSGAALLGFGSGGFLPLPAVFQAACFGRSVVGQVGGLMGFLGLPFQMAIPPLVGMVYDQTGSYELAFNSMIAVALSAAVLLFLVRIPASEPTPEAARP
ncbi:MFS transporter [Myxococcota bacterium]|nr:MFS transporter [Myxococcota bacterium]